MHLTLLYVTALTSTNHHFTVLRHHVCTKCKIISYQALILEVLGGFNLVSISGFLGFLCWRNLGYFQKYSGNSVGHAPCQLMPCGTCAIVLHAFCIAIFIRLNRLSCNTSKHLSLVQLMNIVSNLIFHCNNCDANTAFITIYESMAATPSRPGKKKSGLSFLPFCRNARVWQTDRQTDRQNSHRYTATAFHAAR